LRKAAFITILINIFVLLPAWFFVSYQHEKQLFEQQRVLTTDELAQHANSLSNSIQKRFALLEGLSAFVLANPNQEQLNAKFEIFASALQLGVGGIRNFALAPSGVNGYVYPLQGNEKVLGHSLIDDQRPNVRVDVQRAIKSQQITLSGPYQLRQGGLGLIARKAVFQGDQFWGLATMVVDMPPILTDAGLDLPSDKSDVSLCKAGRECFYGTEQDFAESSVLQRIDLPDGFWEIAKAEPRELLPHLKKQQNIFNGFSSIALILLSLLTYTIASRQTYLTEKVKEQTGDLEEKIIAQRLAEQALFESENQLRMLIEQSPIGLGLCKIDGSLVTVNPAYAQIIGYSVAETLQLTYWDITPDKYAPQEEKYLEQLETEGRYGPYEKEYIHKDGHFVPVLVQGLLIEIRGETFIWSSVNDISERKLLEEKLHHQTAQLEEELTERIAVQEALEDQTEVLKEEVEERRRAQESMRQSEAAVQNKLKAILEPKGDMSTLELADIVDCEMLQALMEDFYKVTGILGAVLDLSGKVLVAVGWQDICVKFHRCHPETLKNCFESDTALTNDVPLGEFKKYRCKNNMWDMVTPLEVGGRHIGNIFIGQFFFKGETVDREMFREQARLYGFDEKEYLEAFDRAPRFSPEVVDAGMKFYSKLTQIISTLSLSSIKLTRMLSERINLEDQLRQSQKLESIGQLAGGVAHDFNNMLGVILGHTELALMKADPSSPLISDLEEIRTAANRSANLTRQLLTFARKQVITPKVLDLNEAVACTLNMLQRLIGENIQLSWNPAANLWPVKIDPSQLDQILANLCVNARDAIAGIGKISIKTANSTLSENAANALPYEAAPGDYTLLFVSDNGCGMDKEVQAHIFEPFYTTKEVGSGTGLGLATVYGAVKQNHGFITFDSEPGLGTAFNIYLPRASKAVEEKQESTEKPLLSGTETILLVEDDKMVLDMEMSMLKANGYTVLAAITTDLAQTLAKEHPGPIHLLISDVIMPEMNGRELSEKLMLLRPDMKVLFLSGYTADIISSEGVVEDEIHFLQKPFSFQTLTAKVREVLDDH
jgi:polar amino acid transport system substrate-binding protein